MEATSYRHDVNHVFSPGLYEDVPDAIYRSAPGVSYSTLKHGHGRTPEEWVWEIGNPSPMADAPKIGIVASDVANFGNCDSITCLPEGHHSSKIVKEAKAISARALAPTKYALAIECGKAIRAHKQIDALFELGGIAEGSLFWTDGRREFDCKGRFDFFCPSAAILNDYKTTERELSDASLKPLIADRLYHCQSAWYRRALRKFGYTVDHCYLTFCRTVRPIQVRVIRLEEVDLQWGEEIMLRLLETYALCHEQDFWPGFGSGVDSLLLPDWARK